MATRFRELDEYIVDVAPRPALRLVEAAPAPKVMPPAWLIAPPFSAELEIRMREQLAYRPAV